MLSLPSRHCPTTLVRWSSQRAPNRGIDTDAGLPDGMRVMPDQSTVPKGRHLCFFDNGKGWLKYTFVRRTEDPQIVVEEIFWQ